MAKVGFWLKGSTGKQNIFASFGNIFVYLHPIKRTQMKKIFNWVLPTILICSAMVLTACSDEDNGVAGGLMARKSTSLFVATDRHEAGGGNNLALSVQTVAGHDDVVIWRVRA